MLAYELSKLSKEYFNHSSLEELEENMKDAYTLMTMEDVPEKHKVKELTLAV